MTKTLTLIYTTKWFSDNNQKRFDFENINLPTSEKDLNFLITNVFNYFLNEQTNAPAIIYSSSDYNTLIIYINYLYFKDMYIGLLRLNADLLNNMILKRLEMIINNRDLYINDRITTNN